MKGHVPQLRPDAEPSRIKPVDPGSRENTPDWEKDE